MNKKGFTLVEIIAIVVILSLIITITATKGFGVFDKAKDKITKENINVIKDAVNILLADVESCDDDIDTMLKDDFNVSSCEALKDKFQSEDCVKVPLSYLIEQEYLSGTSVSNLISKNINSIARVCKGKFKDFQNLNNEDIQNNNENPYKEGTLAYEIYKNKAIVEDYNETGNSVGLITINDIKKMPYPITDIADDASDSGLFYSYDDDGKSFIYRGTVRNNFVNFAGMTWRIVRINGDGSIRLIKESIFETEGSNIDFNQFEDVTRDDNAYVGYMYGLAGTTTNKNRCLMLENDEVVDNISKYSTEETCTNVRGTWTTTAYEATHANIKSSIVKQYVDNWYVNNLSSYNEYLANSTFCGDKSLANHNIGIDNTNRGYGRNRTYYAAVERLFYGPNEAKLNESKPTLKCESRFSTYKVGKNIIYPVGMLSADELVMAGHKNFTENKNIYLYSGDNYWWLMTPFHFGYERSTVFRVNDSGINLAHRISHHYVIFDFDLNEIHGIRPVINLKGDLKVIEGNGKKESPYKVSL